jgi:cell division protein FtsN
MPRTADGEFEILLGNKQLLSIFFIVVILLAVFFTMGYIVGRGANPAGEPPRAAARPPQPAARPEVGGSAGTQASEKPGAASRPEDAEARSTQPQQQLPSPGQAQPPAQASKPAAQPAAPAAGEVYLQAVAGKRPDAELVASVLKRKGFPVLVAPGPNESVFRVLVGPFSDAASMGKTRAELEAAGFKAFPRRY